MFKQGEFWPGCGAIQHITLTVCGLQSDWLSSGGSQQRHRLPRCGCAHAVLHDHNSHVDVCVSSSRLQSHGKRVPDEG